MVDGSRNALRRVVHIESLVDCLRDGLNFGAQFLLDPIEIESILPVDQIDGKTQVPEPSRPTDAMEIGLGVLGKVEVDDHINRLDVDSSSQQIRADQVTANAIAEIVEDSVAALLGHPSMAVEARISEFGNLLGEQLHPVRRVAEDDGLIDL